MKGNLVWLNDYGLIWERVVFIPRKDWTSLYYFEWNRIDSAIKGML